MYIVTEKTYLSNEFDNKKMADPIGDFFRNWTVTKSFIAGLIAIMVLMILIAICRYKFNNWMKEREARKAAKLDVVVVQQQARLNKKQKAIITGQKTNATDLPPTYKSVMKNLMLPNVSNKIEEKYDDTATEINPSSIKTSKTYIPTGSLPDRSSSEYPDLKLGLGSTSPRPISTLTSQAASHNLNSNLTTPCSTLESKDSPNYFDPNGVNPALEREKSRKKFAELQNNHSQLGSVDDMLTEDSVISESLDSKIELPSTHSNVLRNSINLGQVPSNLPKLPVRPGTIGSHNMNLRST